ncbi:transcription antitermination factor NusB [Aurantimonas sp. 22II-16-19i]|uniref:RsmB/NOP family class I SAM-dependent RNA methyltransferase n=1 Tax=Aurantimonas sp. 22II-16-19i TaxID=1317114 RepID=UPI0009F7A0DD|nr:transcription antitermination factor NusB [Aurantimonas sp. 22II-16-19i]ORE97738.1 tRNA/rRNA cytosine-C5-methylase [Aurantimonas sp. 22II-16-19i]
MSGPQEPGTAGEATRAKRKQAGAGRPQRPQGGGRPNFGDADRPGLAARQVAARLLSAVVDKQTSLDGLTDPVGGHPHFRQLSPRDQSLVKAILTSSLRFRGTIEAEIAARLERPLPPNAASLRHVLHVGAAQILCLDVPDSAAVDLAVASAAADPRAQRFTGLVNAVLRRIAREVKHLGAETADARTNCPDWLWNRLAAQYGAERAGAIAAAHLSRAPIDLTVKRDAETWAARLGGRAIGGGVANGPGTVRLDGGEGAISALDGFAEGDWWVQDVAATLPIRLLGEISGLAVADLCAAPGGKTAQLCALGARVTALDQSKTRMKRLEDNLGRLGFAAETVVGDVLDYSPETWFDAVLLDAPCSSTGTIRRHPDVAYTKDDAEIDKLAALQLRLLDKAADLVAPGGRLVFANCSLDMREGEAVAKAFLAARPGYRLEAIEPGEMAGFEFAVSAEGTLRTTPDMLGGAAGGGMDGFFAARFRHEKP